MIKKQDEAWPVISMARTYRESGGFSEPFIKATFLISNIATTPGTAVGEIDCSGLVLVYNGIPVVFDCATNGVNTTNIYIKVIDAADPVTVYWTKYQGFTWQE